MFSALQQYLFSSFKQIKHGTQKLSATTQLHIGIWPVQMENSPSTASLREAELTHKEWPL